MPAAKKTDLRSHFGLTTTPFTRELPVKKRWSHSIYDDTVRAFQQVVEERMSGALISPAGSGKTMVLRTLASRLSEARYRVHYIKVTSLSKRDMCREIAFALGCGTAGQYNTLVRRIQEYSLTSLDHDGLRAVLLIDEAHDMRPTVLAILRILTNFEMDSRLVVSIILSGQNPLGRMLRRDDLDAVSRRMAHYAALRNLGREEVRKYITHRVRAADGRGDLFDDGAHDAIFEMGGGNLRATNKLALKSLLIAAAENASVAEADHVTAAREQLWP